jgi:hypothetical protein
MKYYRSLQRKYFPKMRLSTESIPEQETLMTAPIMVDNKHELPFRIAAKLMRARSVGYSYAVFRKNLTSLR